MKADHWLVVEASRFHFGVVFKHYDHCPSVKKRADPLTMLLDSTTLRVSSTNKAFIIITLTIKKCNNMLKNFLYLPCQQIVFEL